MHRAGAGPAILLLGPLLFGGCDAASPGDSAPERVSVRDSAGIRIVTSPAPAWLPREVWTIGPDPVVRIGAADGDAPYLFTWIWDGVLRQDGTVAVVDADTHEIRLFDADGRHLRTLGGTGGGPGEFSRMAPNVAFAGGDTLVAWESVRGRLVWLGTDGSALAERDVRADLGGPDVLRRGNPEAWRLLPDGSVLASADRRVPGSERSGLLEETWSVELLAPGSGGFLPVSEMAFAPSGRTPQGIIATNPFAAHGAVAGGGAPPAIFVGHTERWEIQVYDGGGALRQILRPAIARSPATPALAERHWETLLEMYGGASVVNPDLEPAFRSIPLPDSVAPIRSLHLDHDGNLWVGHAPEGGYKATGYEVFSADGRWLGPVAMPPDLYGILDIGSDRLLAMHYDELGVASATLYEIRKPEGR